MNKAKFSIIIMLAAVLLIAAACNKAEAPTTDQTSTQGDQQSSKTYKVDGTEGDTALEALDDKYDVVVKESAGRGKYAESIEGITPDSNHYWAFYVNGQASLVGAGQYTAKDGDKFEFRLEAIQN